jgi:hypothetical protein
MTLVDEGEGESVGGGWIRFEDGQEYRPLVRPAPEEPEAT